MPVIDFFGPPGSGKSTLIARLLRRNRTWFSVDQAAYFGLRTWLRDKGKKKYNLALLPYEVSRRLYPESMLLKFYAHRVFRDDASYYTAYFDYILNALLRLKIPTEKRVHLFQSLIEPVAHDYFLRQRPPCSTRIVLADEHFGQKALSLHALREGIEEEDAIKAYADSIPPLDYLVSVNAPDDATCLIRMRGRSRGVLKAWNGLPEAEIYNRLRRVRVAQKIFCEYLRMRGTTVIYVKNNDLKQSCFEIEDQILR